MQVAAASTQSFCRTIVNGDQEANRSCCEEWNVSGERVNAGPRSPNPSLRVMAAGTRAARGLTGSYFVQVQHQEKGPYVDMC